MEQLNFSTLLAEGPTPVVSFENKQQAEHFLYEVKRKYGKWFRSSPCPWSYGDKTVYGPQLDSKTSTMWFHELTEAKRDGYRVVPYRDLLERPDYGEIKCRDEFILSGLI